MICHPESKKSRTNKNRNLREDDEYHLLLEYTLLQDLRKRFIPKYYRYRPSMIKCLELLGEKLQEISRNQFFVEKSHVIDQYMLILWVKLYFSVHWILEREHWTTCMV